MRPEEEKLERDRAQLAERFIDLVSENVALRAALEEMAHHWRAHTHFVLPFYGRHAEDCAGSEVACSCAFTQSKRTFERGREAVDEALAQYPKRRTTMTLAMTFGQAIEALKAGKKVARAGWNGKGMWLALQVPDEHSKMTAPYIYMKTADEKLVPWLASQTDVLSEDWSEVA